jgi:REP element-mobilizing transposase RayT
VSHSSRAKLAARFPVLVTLRLCEGLRTLREERAAARVQAAFEASAREDFHVAEWSIQANHLHLLVEARDGRALSRGMNGLAVRIARGLNRLWRRVGRVFGDRYHSRVLRSPSEVRRALVYVLPERAQARAWFARVADVFSSGRSFGGWREGNSADSSRRSRAWTWLLAVGWRRLGLIGLLEGPKGAVEGGDVTLRG